MTTDNPFGNAGDQVVTDDGTEGARREPPPAVDYLTTADLERIRAELTMGDTWRARDLEPADQKRAGQLGLWIVAKRIGLADPTPAHDDHDAFYAFLDRIKVDDVNATYGKEAEAARGPKSADGQDSPDSVSTGE